MKTAISVPDRDFVRFEKAAEDLGMNRSEFYRRAADQFVEGLNDGAALTRIADAALAEAGQPSDEDLFLGESERRMLKASEW